MRRPAASRAVALDADAEWTQRALATLLLLTALGLGLALGGASAFGREFLDRSIRDARKLQDEFEVPVLAEIPRIHGAA